MRIAGVPVSDSAAAELALLVHQAGDPGLAMQLGLAIDHGRDFTPGRRDCEALARLLAERCPERLVELRGRLVESSSEVQL